MARRKCERCGKPVKRPGARWCSTACYMAVRYYAGLVDHESRLNKLIRRYAKEKRDYAYRATLKFYRAYKVMPCDDESLYGEWLRMLDDEKDK